MGITRHTVNKVFPGLIPIPPAFMFPEEYNDLMPLCFPVYLEPKIHGTRIKLFSSASGDVAAWNPKYTNYSHLFKQELEVMAEEAIKSNTDIEVDGELCEWKNVVYTGFMVKTPPKEGKAFVFKAFDSVRSAEKDKPLVERRRDLVRTVVKLRKDGVRDPQSVPLYFHLVPAAEASSKEDVLRFHTKVHAKTNEGVILKDPHSRYERGRSTAWLCMRTVRTEEAEILEIIYDADKRVGCLLCRTYAGEEILVNVEERLRDTLLTAKASLVGSTCKLTVKEGIECSTYSLLKLLHEKTL
jgi:ATP-dependent DNA ligase